MPEKPTYEELEQKILKLKQAEYENRRTAEELRIEKEFIRAALNSQLDTFFLFESDTGKAIRWNRAFSDITGYTDEEIAGMKAPDSYYSTEDLGRVAGFIVEAMDTGTGTIELDLICKDGHVVATEYKVSVIRDKEDKPKYFFSIGRDITSRKQAEAALKESEEKYRLLADNTVDCIWLMNMDLVFTYINPAIYKMTGFTTEEWIGSKLEDHCDNQNFEKMAQIVIDVFKKLPDNPGVVFETTMLKKNKDPLYAEIIGKVLLDEAGTPVGLHGVTRDISERKHSEQALRQERDRAQQYLDIAGVMFVGIDLHQKVTLVNQKACEVLGYKHKDIIGKNWFDNFIPENIRTEVKAYYGKLMTEEAELVKDFENPVLSIDAGKRIIAWHNTIIRDKNNNIIGTLSSGEDITQRKLAEKALLKSEERYRLLADNVSDNIWIYELEALSFSYVSPSVFSITGFTAEEATGFQLEDTLTPRALELANKVLAEELTAAVQQFDPTRSHTFELEQYHKSGSTVWTEVAVQFIYDKNNQPTAVLGVTRDISERKRLQNKLIKSQKMESLGLLAGGVAHDLNNVLSGIVTYPELILFDLPEDSKLKKPLKTMMEAGNRAVAIVQDLLTVARGVAMAREPVQLNDLVNEYLNSPEFNTLKQLHPTITLKTLFDNDLLNISASYIHVRKLVMNLIVNASEAIKGDGRITISTRNRYIDKPLRGYDEVSIGEYAVLSISDDGPGISANDLERIFEPFLHHPFQKNH